MLKFVLSNNEGRRLIGLGLEEGNVTRLRSGQPIVFLGEDVELPGFDFVIFLGEDQAELRRQVQEVFGVELSFAQKPTRLRP